jgi:glycosyltransferase involved in cell wall biosynthesis
MKPRLHLVGIFHTQHTAAYSHCAFTGKALRFPKMMQGQGYTVIEYSNAGSESSADEHVTMLDAAEFDALFQRNATDFHGNDATVGSPAHQLFEQRLIPALRERLQPEDIICHPFGHAHQQLMAEFPNHQHVETGIGYPTLMPNSFRIFESYAWMHYHQGKEGRNGKNYEWVVPNYYDLDDWQPSYEPGQYLAFLGRITALKGIDTIKAIADYSPWPIVLHGQGDPSPWAHPNIEYRGPITGAARSEFLRNARALLAPTVFTEPFCGMAVEAMLCGTPVVSVDYGAMTETITEGVMGYRCHTLQDWIDGINAAGDLDRRIIADTARAKWSLEACGARYDKIFRQLNDLYRKGWYETQWCSGAKLLV